METLKKRADFVRISQQGQKFITSHFILLTASMPEAYVPPEVDIRVGYTVTKKLGGAVIRNRIKRRLREAVRQVMAERGRAGQDYVLIARKSALDAPFDKLTASLHFALARIHRAAPNKDAVRS